MADINENTGRHVADEISSNGRNSIFVKVDVTKEEEIKIMINTVISEFGGLDIAVNNAYASNAGWDAMMKITLNSVYWCSLAEAQEMAKKNRGKIINIASISGTIVNVAGYAYCTAKAGVIMLTRCMAVEWAKHNINVNSISPTYALSPVKRRESKTQRNKIRSLHPMGWYARPEDMCGTLIYLASDASNYVTGRDIIIDGGHTLNVWLDPPERVASSLVATDKELLSMIHDMDVLGIQYDEDGIEIV